MKSALKKLFKICLDLNEERCNFMTLFGPLLLSVYIWIWPWSKVWKTLKQKCLGPKFEKRYEKEVICLGYNLEVFTFQFWTWSKDGTLACKKDCFISVGGSLALKGMENLKSKVQDVHHFMVYGWRWDLYWKIIAC